MSAAFTISGDTASIFFRGRMWSVPEGDHRFEEVVDLLLSGDYTDDELQDVLDTPAKVRKMTGGLVEVTEDSVTYNGEPVTGLLAERLLKFCNEEGTDATPWVNFMNNLMQNPSYRARESLYEFLEKWEAPITADGRFIAFKNVRGNFRDIHSGKFDNSPGKVVTMDRSKVDDNNDRTCSAGLHVCAPSYLSSFYTNGGKTVACAVNPRDVVSVPRDYQSAKMRTCQYEVLNEVASSQVSSISKSNYYDPDYYEYDLDEYDDMDYTY